MTRRSVVGLLLAAAACTARPAILMGDRKVDPNATIGELNAEILDADKVAAFAAGIARLEEPSLALISGQTVRLNFPALQLHRYSALTAEQLRRSFALGPERNDNPKLAAVRLVAPLSVGLARTRIASASQAVAERDASLRRIAATPAAEESLVLAANLRQQRRSAAMVWLALAEDLARQRPAPADAAALVEAARKALQSDSVAPRSGGMPG